MLGDLVVFVLVDLREDDVFEGGGIFDIVEAEGARRCVDGNGAVVEDLAAKRAGFAHVLNLVQRGIEGLGAEDARLTHDALIGDGEFDM